MPAKKESISWFITLLLWAQRIGGVRRLAVRPSLLDGKKKGKVYVFFAFAVSLIGLFAFDLYYVDLADSMRIRSTVDLHILLYSFTIVWVVFSGGVTVFWCFDIQKKYIIPLICCGILSIYYVNLLYEFCISGDTLDYAAAVNNLINNEVFHPRYLYPPFFAILFKPLVGIGGGRLLFDAIWIGNFISIITLYVLLVGMLRKYGASGTIASLLSFVFMLLNVPVMRTLVFGQINLWITICIIGCVLAYTRSSMLLLSALLLSIAIHLKVSPLLCILPFLITRDSIWISLLLLFTCLILVGTLLTDGFLPYISFFNNIIDLRESIGLSYRDGSIDSLVYTLFVTSQIVYVFDFSKVKKQFSTHSIRDS